MASIKELLSKILPGLQNGKKHLKEMIPYEPEFHTPVIRSSICTGEKAAGFKDSRTGKFIEVMVIHNEDEKNRFMKMYGLSQITTEY